MNDDLSGQQPYQSPTCQPFQCNPSNSNAMYSSNSIESHGVPTPLEYIPTHWSSKWINVLYIHISLGISLMLEGTFYKFI